MSKLNVNPVYNPDMEAWDIDTTDYYGNWNKVYEQFLGNDAALKGMIDDTGLKVVDGKLCMEFERG